MTQHCKYCGDFYRCDDKELAIETQDGWIIDICRQCHTEFNCEEQALSEAWQWWYDQQLDEEAHL